MNRAMGGARIFIDKGESERFLDNLARAVERFAVVIHAFCLMPSHYHLLVQIKETNLSSAIQWLNVSYAAYFNKKHERKGHLFQGRFKAILVDGDQYIKELSRYIHLNPVRAGMVEKPHQYPWSSYPYFIGCSECPDWLKTDWLLGCFVESKKAAEQVYREFVEGAQLDSIKNPHDDLVEGFLLGDSQFVEWIKERFLRGRKSDGEIPQLKHLLPRPSVEAVIAETCRTVGTREEDIRRKGPKRNLGRDLAIYLARECTGLSCKELGAIFGGVSGAAITMKCKGVIGMLEADRKLKKSVDRVRKKILNF